MVTRKSDTARREVERTQRKREEIITPKRMQILKDCLEPRFDWYDRTSRPAAGYVQLNCEGGYGFDRVVRHMVRRGELILRRHVHRFGKFGDSYPLTRLHAVATVEGARAYAAWAKRMR